MKSILKSENFLTEARELLVPPLMTPSGDVRQEWLFNSSHFSNWLGLRLEEVIKSFPEWRQTQPVLLGSWARGEFCLKSDIDMLFCGDEKITVQLVAWLNEQGYKLRYRVPQDPEDWTVNVEAFDILALLKAKPLTTEAARALMDQQKKILLKRKHYGKVLLQAISQERKKRAERFDSITNFLEPNLKYGPGGLRDLEQGLQVYELFAEKIPNPAHTLAVLKFYKSYWLTIRQKLHLEGVGDVLVNTSQFDLAAWMGFKNQKDFMRDFQRGLSRVNFYSDWLVEAAQASEKKLIELQSIPLKKPRDLANALRMHPQTLMQKKVRENLNALLPTKDEKRTAKLRGKIIDEMLSTKTSDESLVAHFRSRLIDKLVPEIKRLVGYVQHDQYHRFTADTHIMQACRECKRIHGKASQLGSLQIFHKKLKPLDWKILRWSCLYHDLAKGLGGHEHSHAGAEIVRRDFKGFGFAKKFTDEVAWMVENHLELSQAAFRKNPKSPQVWQDLKEKEVTGARLYRLVLFTAIDIRATNPEAWTDWKARLLKDLALSVESKSALNYFNFSTERKKRQLQLPLEIYEELDPLLIDSLSTSVLIVDLKKAEQATTDLTPLLVQRNKNEIWVRFHHKKDRRGVLVECVAQLSSLGVGVRHAAIQTLPRIGVYNWFQITTTKTLPVLTKLLENVAPMAGLSFAPAATSLVDSSVNPQSVHFESIELMSTDEKEWVLSFKGLDQPGLLAAAVLALASKGISVKSARVHTWGRQIEDVFLVKPEGDPQVLLEGLKTHFA